MKISPVLKYPGAKWSLAEWVISHFPPHITYLEPFFGSGAVFFNKKPSKIETINDVDGNIVSLFKVIRDRPDELARLLKLTPWARDEYYASYEKTGDEIEDARRYIVRLWQAFGSKTSDRTGWRNDIQGRKDNMTTTWRKLPDRLIAAATRLMEAQIENQTAVEIINRYKFPEVLIYADPPYPLSTRSKRMYANEMTDADHEELLGVLKQHPGPVIISGYSCKLYDGQLKNWTRKTCKAQAELGRQREEIIWINPTAAEANRSLFSEVKKC